MPAEALKVKDSEATTPPSGEYAPQWRWLDRGRRRWRTGDAEPPRRGGPDDALAVDIPPHDPLLAWLQMTPEPVLVDGIRIDSPGVRALREAGVVLVAPLVAQGELIGLLNLGERRSEQVYSSDDRKLLESLANQAAPALRVAQLVRKQQAEARQRERVEQELRVAQLIQQHFLPKTLPSTAGWHVEAFYRPAREVGGDFYDFVDLPGGTLGVMVGDVTDKGVPAALVMASTRSVLRSSAQRLIDPGAVLERVNGILAPDMPPNMFVTCLYGVLEPSTGRFRFANAGHNLPCVQTDDGAVEVRATGMPLGLMPSSTYDENETVVAPGHTLLLYSDALPEAHNEAGDMLGFPRLVEVAGAAGTRVMDALLTELDRFTGPDWEQEDDITLVSLIRTGHKPNHAAGPEGAAAGTGATGATGATGDRDGRALASFAVPSVPGNEREVMNRVIDAVADLPIDPTRLERLGTAVSEATMNAIEHGNANDGDLLVEVRVVATQDDVVVRIVDQGIGGPVSDDVEEPDLAAKLRGEQTPRGWGLFLIRNMVDELREAQDVDQHTIELIVRMNGAQDG